MQHLRRPRTLDLVLVAAVAVVAGLLLIWSATPKTHVVDAPATPGNEMLDDHAWGERGCVLPGAGIDSVPVCSTSATPAPTTTAATRA